MKSILLCLSLLPVLAFATDMEDAVRDVAESKMSMGATIYEKSVEIVYVGQSGYCEAVSIMWTRQRIESFRVCGGEVQPRNTVSPAWDESDGRPALLSVVNNAILYGKAKQKDRNGYLISAQTLNAVRHDCKNIEVIVSYDGDLVDRDVHEVCDKYIRHPVR